MAAPILHVIYAGRADAMILECDDYNQVGRRNFILMDGGPKNYDAYGAREAPYHRYLSSACQQVMGNGNNFAGIIFSHPDEDHYVGYLHSLHRDISVGANMRKVVPHPQDQFPDYLIPLVKAIFPSGIVWYYGGTDLDEAQARFLVQDGREQRDDQQELKEIGQFSDFL